MIEVMERKGRPTVLNNRRMYMKRGVRYATRAAVRAVLQGRASSVPWQNCQRGKWYARASNTRLKIGCHVWSGKNFKVIRDWALA